MNFEYPLQWNMNVPRTQYRGKSRFGNRSAYAAGQMLERELTRLGGKDVVISSNLRIKTDGGFYASQTRIEDPGVCVYLKLKGKEKCFACDRWDKPEDNIWALALNVAAIRGMERWGGSNFMDGLFTGFAALAAPGSTPNYFVGCKTKDEAEEKYKALVKKLHPDVGGNAIDFQNMSNEYRKKLEGLK